MGQILFYLRNFLNHYSNPLCSVWWNSLSKNRFSWTLNTHFAAALAFYFFQSTTFISFTLLFSIFSHIFSFYTHLHVMWAYKRIYLVQCNTQKLCSAMKQFFQDRMLESCIMQLPSRPTPSAWEIFPVIVFIRCDAMFNSIMFFMLPQPMHIHMTSGKIRHVDSNHHCLAVKYLMEVDIIKKCS